MTSSRPETVASIASRFQQLEQSAPLEKYQLGEAEEQTTLQVPLRRWRKWPWLTIARTDTVIEEDLVAVRSEEYFRLKTGRLRRPQLLYGGAATYDEGQPANYPNRYRPATEDQAQVLLTALDQTTPESRFIGDQTVRERAQNLEMRKGLEDHVNRIFTAAGDSIHTLQYGRSVTLPYNDSYLHIFQYDNFNADRIVLSFGGITHDEWLNRRHIYDEFTSIPSSPLMYSSGILGTEQKTERRDAYPEQKDFVFTALKEMTTERITAYVESRSVLDGEVDRLIQLEPYQQISPDPNTVRFYSPEREIFVQQLPDQTNIVVRYNVPVDAPDGTIEQYFYTLIPRGPMRVIIGRIGDISPYGDEYSVADTNEMNTLTTLLTSLPTPDDYKF